MPDISPASSTSPSGAALRDADIQAQLLAGDGAAAFTALLERYELKVFRLCVSLLHDTSQAQDMAQEVFLRVWRYLGHYDADSGAFSTWIYAIARNQCLSALAKQPRPCDSLDDADVWQKVAQIPTATEVNDAASLALLRKLVQALPATQRSCLLLYYFEDNSVAEVAALLDLPLNMNVSANSCMRTIFAYAATNWRSLSPVPLLPVSVSACCCPGFTAWSIQLPMSVYRWSHW